MSRSPAPKADEDAIEHGERPADSPLQPDQPQHPSQPRFVQPRNPHHVRVAVGRRRIELKLIVRVQEARADQIDQRLERNTCRLEERGDVRQRLDQRSAGSIGAGQADVPPDVFRSARDDREVLRRRAQRLGGSSVAHPVAATKGLQ